MNEQRPWWVQFHDDENHGDIAQQALRHAFVTAWTEAVQKALDEREETWTALEDGIRIAHWHMERMKSEIHYTAGGTPPLWLYLICAELRMEVAHVIPSQSDFFVRATGRMFTLGRERFSLSAEDAGCSLKEIRDYCDYWLELGDRRLSVLLDVKKLAELEDGRAAVTKAFQKIFRREMIHGN